MDIVLTKGNINPFHIMAATGGKRAHPRWIKIFGAIQANECHNASDQSFLPAQYPINFHLIFDQEEEALREAILNFFKHWPSIYGQLRLYPSADIYEQSLYFSDLVSFRYFVDQVLIDIILFMDDDRYGRHFWDRRRLLEDALSVLVAS